MLERKPLLLLWSGIQFTLLLLLNQAFALWVSAIFALLMLYRLLTVLTARPAVSLRLVNILAGIIALAFFLQLKQSGVLHFMLQILLLAATARLLALQHLYEARQLVWVHYFLIASCFQGNREACFFFNSSCATAVASRNYNCSSSWFNTVISF